MSEQRSGALWKRVPWSNTWLSWQERIGLIAFGVAAALLVMLGVLWLPIWLTALFSVLFLLALAIGTQQGWLRLFGPVLFYDMICTARRSRYLIMRLTYATLLLSILCTMYLTVHNERHMEDPRQLAMCVVGQVIVLVTLIVTVALLLWVESTRARVFLGLTIGMQVILFILLALYVQSAVNRHAGPEAREVARLAEARLGEAFFSIYLIVQIALVVLLTPAYVAGAISDEKDRKTLEFLLATDLANHEIILSKLLSRFANLTLFLLTGLPILSVLQFMGGIDANLLLAGFAGTGLTMLGVGSVSILLSTLLKKPRDSIGMTYLVIVCYVALGTVAFAMTKTMVWFMSETLWFDISLADVGHVLNSGNPLVAILSVSEAIMGRGPRGGVTSLSAELPEILARYTWFQVPLAVVCVTWAILRLRSVALRQTVAGTTQALNKGASRIAVGEEPMLWKELYVDGKLRANWISWLAGGVLVLLTLGSGLLILVAFLWDTFFHAERFHMLTDEMNSWFRFAGTGVASLILLMVGVRASTAITSEQERDTFDALLTTPVSAESILLAKLLGSIFSLRIAWFWLASLLALALLTGGLHLLAAPIIVTSWFVYAVFFAMVGLAFSMTCRSSMRSTVLTVLTTLFLGGGHWVIWLVCCLPFVMVARMDHPGSLPEFLAKFQAGMTPPFVMAFCAYSWMDLERFFHHRDEVHLLVFSLLGLFLWAAACLVMWYGVLVPRFRQLARREELLYDAPLKDDVHAQAEAQPHEEPA